MGNPQAAVQTLGNGRPAKAAPAAAKAPEKAPARAAAPVPEEAPATRPHTLLFFFLTAVVLFIGWWVREEEYMVPESGAGYALGIVGAASMVLLLLYPLRKKAAFMRDWGAVKHWFRAHMVLGILGPVLVLFHANFAIGSMNSNVVLAITLLVAGSGLVGRYIYTKIHYGLYGRQVTLKELRAEVEARKDALGSVMAYAPKLKARLLGFGDAAEKQCLGVPSSLMHYAVTSVRARWTKIALLVGLSRALKVAARRSGWDRAAVKREREAALGHISSHMDSALRVAEFSVYERLMALWHLFHFPLFMLLIIVLLIHVVAVHMY